MTAVATQSVTNQSGATLTIYNIDIAKANAWEIYNYGTMVAQRLTVYGGSVWNEGTLSIVSGLTEDVTDYKFSTTTVSYVYNTGTLVLSEGGYYYAGTNNALSFKIEQLTTGVDAVVVGTSTGDITTAYLRGQSNVGTIAHQSISNAKVTVGTGDALTMTSVTLINTQIVGEGDSFSIDASDLTLQVDIVAATDTLEIDVLGSATTTTLTGTLTLDIVLADSSVLGDNLDVSLSGNLVTSDLSAISVDFYTTDEEGNLVYYTSGDTSAWTAGESGALIFSVTSEAIPEPTTVSLSFLALLGLLSRRQRKRAT